ncbi:hypothetical protein AEGHOMDF_4460 [Methylobacterium soli]|nr:hypothetical protein AEGHOMDF_4460 [Methylobacterium soli]
MEAPRDGLDAVGQLAAAATHGLGDPLGGADELVADMAGAGREALDDAARRQGEAGLGLAPAGLDHIGHARAGRLDLGPEIRAAGGDIVGQGRAGRGDMGPQAVADLGKARRDLAAGAREPLGQLAAARQECALQEARRTLEALAHIGALPIQGIDHAGAGLGERARDLAGIVGERRGQDAAGALEGAGHLIGAALQGLRQGIADIRQAAADALARRHEALNQVVAAARHDLNHALAGFAEGRRYGIAPRTERARDRIPARIEGGGDAVTRTRHRGDDALCCSLQFLAQALVRAGDRSTDALRIRDDRLALRHEFIDEGPDPDLVIRIGAFEGGDLAAHEGFQFARTSERTLHPVADGRDLAADRLRHRQHGIGREAFRLGEADRHLSDRARDEPHLLRPNGQHGGDQEQHDRPGDRGRADGCLDCREAEQKAPEIAAGLAPGQGDEAVQPDERRDRGEQVGFAGGAHAQRLLQDPDVAPVVIGNERSIRRKQAALAVRPIAVGRRHVRGKPLVQIEAGHLAPGRLNEGIVVADIRQARLWAGLGLIRRQDIEIQRLLDRRQRRLRRILQLLLSGHATPRYAQSHAAGRARR